MTLKNLSFVLLTALCFIWVSCDNDDTSGDTYVDIIMQVSEKPFMNLYGVVIFRWNTCW